MRLLQKHRNIYGHEMHLGQEFQHDWQFQCALSCSKHRDIDRHMTFCQIYGAQVWHLVKRNSNDNQHNCVAVIRMYARISWLVLQCEQWNFAL